MRLVLDTDVVVRAMRSPRSASARLIELAATGHVQLVATSPLVLEYEAVCLRPGHITSARIGMAQAEAYLDGLAHLIEPVRVNFSWRGFLPDPDDDLVLEAALNADADALVTFNRRDFEIVVRQFNLNLQLPGDILANLGTST